MASFQDLGSIILHIVEVQVFPLNHEVYTFLPTGGRDRERMIFVDVSSYRTRKKAVGWGGV